MNDQYNDIYNESRNAAHNIRISFDAGAWDKMKALLDEDDKAPVAYANSNRFAERNNKKAKWILLFLATLLTGSSALYIRNKSCPAPVYVTGNNSRPTGNKSAGMLNESITLPVQEPEQTTSFSLNKDQETGFNKTAKLPVLIRLNYKKDPGTIGDGSKNDLALPKKNGADEQAAVNTTTSFSNLYRDHLTDEIIKLPNGSIEEDSAAAPVMKTAGPVTKKNKNNNITAPTKKGILKNIGFSVLLSPEVSMVNFKGGGQVTAGYGVGISYAFGKHFSLQAMFVNARKLYATDKKGYTPVSGSSLYNADTLNVNADCSIWDIPLNLRYSFKGNDKNSLFISAGVSSYIMKKEIYDFVYFDQGNYYSKQRIISNENKHSFCNLNLTVGYQYWLNKKWSIGFEPYLKLPLSGIGGGKVKLTSAGALFSLTFKPL